jgi:hypothetical protein
MIILLIIDFYNNKLEINYIILIISNKLKDGRD